MLDNAKLYINIAKHGSDPVMVTHSGSVKILLDKDTQKKQIGEYESTLRKLSSFFESCISRPADTITNSILAPWREGRLDERYLAPRHGQIE